MSRTERSAARNGAQCGATARSIVSKGNIMRIRRAFSGLVLAAAVTVAGLAAPAQAASPNAPAGAVAATTTVYGNTDGTQGEAGVQESWRFWRSYWTEAACDRGALEVLRQGYEMALCQPGYGTDGRWKYHLYVWS
jgi:hypothetical protein